MTVQELINELQKVENKNLKVVVRGSDPTDFTYYNDVESVERDKVYYEEFNINTKTGGISPLTLLDKPSSLLSYSIAQSGSNPN